MLSGVPQGEGEHSPEAVDAGGAALFVEVDDRLRIRRRLETMAPGLEVRSQVAVVVDLAVEDDDALAGLVEDGLPSAREVDDAQAAHPEGDGTLEVHAVLVRAAVLDGRQHPLEHGPVDGATGVAVDDPYDAAHGSAP